MFPRDRAAASFVLTHSSSGAYLGFELPGNADARDVSGATATAHIGPLVATWISYADRLKENLTLSARPASDSVSFLVHIHGLQLNPDGQGGYLAIDKRSHLRFHVLAPTVTDARGQAGKATLSLDTAHAEIQLDPAFLATAAYPIDIDPTVLYGDIASGTNSFTPAAGETDLALGTSPTQSSILSNPCDPEAAKAVDGNTDGSFPDCSTTHTNSDTQAWWQVDLHADMPIDTIQLWNRTDCCSDRLSDFYVFVSDTPFSSTDPNVVQNQSGVLAIYHPGPFDGAVLNVPQANRAPTRTHATRRPPKLLMATPTGPFQTVPRRPPMPTRVPGGKST